MFASSRFFTFPSRAPIALLSRSVVGRKPDGEEIDLFFSRLGIGSSADVGELQVSLPSETVKNSRCSNALRSRTALRLPFRRNLETPYMSSLLYRIIAFLLVCSHSDLASLTGITTPK